MKKKKIWVIAMLVLLLSSTFLPILQAGAQSTENSTAATTDTSSSEQVLESEVTPPEQTTETSQTAAAADTPVAQSEEPEQANTPIQVTQENLVVEETPTVSATTNQTGKLVVRLVDEENSQLQLGNGVFRLVETSGKFSSNRWTDLNSDLVYDNLPFGNYILEQSSSPIGFQPSGFNVSFEIKEGATYFEYTVTNKREVSAISVGEIHVISVDDADPNKRLAGARYQLENTATGAVILDQTDPTDSNGELIIKNIPIGNYRLTKNGSPEGYGGPTVSFTFPLTQTDVDTNNFPTYTFTYIKQADVGHAAIEYLATGETTPLAGGEFTLYDANGKVLERQTTEQGQLLYFRKLQPGKSYRIKLTKTPAGYEESTEEKPLFDETFTVTTQALTFLFKVYNNKLPEKNDGKLTIMKFAEGDETATIGGAEFTLYDDSGKQIATQRTKAGQALVFAELADGTYRIKETKAPTGYQQPTFEESFTIDQTNNSIEYKVFNQKIPTEKGQVRVQLYDEDDEKTTIGGAEFTLYDEKGNKVDRKTTVSGKELVFENLDFGSYVLRQTKFPTGYATQDIQKSFNIDATAKEKLFSFTNKKLTVLNNITVTGKARDKSTGSNEGYAQKASTIIEEIRYQNVEVNKEYTIKTLLMDPVTNQPLLINGKEVRAEKTFTAKKPNGTMEVMIDLDSSSLAGKRVVVFVRLYQKDKEVVNVSDISDSVQTITYPIISTKAASYVVGEKLQIRDEVSYSNLVAGQTYTVKGQLMDRETGLPYKINDEKIISEATFTAEKSNGVTEVVFEFDKNAITKATTLVVFEQLFNSQGSLVASHQDLSDENQTIHLGGEKIEAVQEHTTYFNHTKRVREQTGRSATTYRAIKTLPKTGSKPQVFWNVIGLFLMMVGVGITLYKRNLEK